MMPAPAQSVLVSLKVFAKGTTCNIHMTVRMRTLWRSIVRLDFHSVVSSHGEER
jgi:hypothetical protein